MNVTFVWDWSHGAQNDWKAMLRDMGPLPVLAAHDDAWSDLFNNLSPEQCPLFTDLLLELSKEVGPAGATGQDGSAIVWEHLKTHPPFSIGQPKVNLTRFFSTTECASSFVGKWHTALLNYQYYGIEQGMMAQPQFRHMAVTTGVTNALETTSRQRAGLDDKILRQSSSNAVEVAVLMLSDPWHRQMVQTILLAGKAVEAWHREQAHLLRDVVSNRKWFVQQATGGFAKHLIETRRCLEDLAGLEKCGMQISSFKTKQKLGALEVQMEDDLA
eukprot:6467661-Amphidinium_carterae.1